MPSTFFRPAGYLSAGCFFLLLAVVTCWLSVPVPAAAKPKAADLVKDGQPIDLSQEKYRKLFAELKTKHLFTEEELEEIFQGLTISRRVLELMDKQWEARPYYKYYPLFITDETIRTGREKLVEYKQVLDDIEKKIGVDREIIIAIWGIETRFGANLGGFNVLRTLNTLFDAYPRRSSFFRKQLVHFLILCRENQVDPKTVEGSYAGAFGQTQFIPSSFRAYAVSFDGDEKRDVWNSVPDVLASIANYLKQFHWVLHAPVYAELGSTLNDQRLIAAALKGRKGRVEWKVVRDAQNPDLPRPPEESPLAIVALELPPNNGSSTRYVAAYPNFIAITRWNNSNRYAMAVTELAEAITGRKLTDYR